MPPHPPEPRIVHPLSTAPEFVGRDRELHALCEAWASGSAGVLALVGLGGAGKTALAARFLAELLAPGGMPRPSGLFVWSFYQEPDAGRFLEELHRYFAGDAGAASPARGAGLLHLLREAVSSGGPHLLVLDGLERVQQQDDTEAGGHGKIEDPLLRGLLTRIAEGAGRASVLVTSRFPLADLEPFRGRGYRTIDVEGLDREAAIDLLRRRGVSGDDDALAGLVDAYGAHALTLDHLGGLIGQFLGGDAGRAPEAPTLATPGRDRQALRLARLLRAYEDHLPPAELELLCRLCLLRTTVSEGQVLRLFLCAPRVNTRSAREAADLMDRRSDADRRPGEEGLLTALAGAAIEEALCTAPLAGPADDFPREILEAVKAAIAEAERLDPEEHGDALVRLYAGSDQDPPTEQRPLPTKDRAALRSLGDAYHSLRQHPLMAPPPKHHDALVKAFSTLGWDVPVGNLPDDRSPIDIAISLRRVARLLHRIYVRHAALKCVRAFCRARQEKWTLAGPLASLDAEGFRRSIADLERRHLVIREADGTIGVHPAVRDHFARLGDPAGRGLWHDLIRTQMIALANRPGRALPDDKAALDLHEEAIHHALEAGRIEDARALYERGLGGLRHLGWKLGEMARGLRILRSFPECPDDSALGWFLRALGELDRAYDIQAMPYFRADVRLLQGRLPEVAAEGDAVRARTAALLMGDLTAGRPPDLLGMAVPRIQVQLLTGQVLRASQTPPLDRLYGRIGWEGDLARERLLMAEASRRTADADGAANLLSAATPWVLHSGSIEHLCLWHLVRSRIEADAGNLSSARRALDDGIHAARQSGMGLYLVLLLIARAEVLLRPDVEAAEHSALEARLLASDPTCRFRWAEADAGQVMGQALAAQLRFGAARAVLKEAFKLRVALGDPRAEATRRLLDRLPT